MTPAQISFALVAIVFAPALAQAAPPSPLLGKSVIISGTEQRSFRPVGGGEVQSANASFRWTVYISTAGRTFVRSDRTSSLVGTRDPLGRGWASKAIDTAPGDGAIGTGIAGGVQFSGANTQSLKA